MGIRTDPGYGLYVSFPAECFWPLQTPKKVYCTLSGIKKGTAWTPARGECMNGSYILEYFYFNQWGWTGAAAVIQTNIRYATTWAVAANEKAYEVFRFNQIASCKWLMVNEYQSSSGYFYGGYMSLMIREPITGVPSIQNTQNLVGVPRDRKTFAEPSVDENGKAIIRLARQSDGTCIRVKIG